MKDRIKTFAKDHRKEIATTVLVGATVLVLVSKGRKVTKLVNAGQALNLCIDALDEGADWARVYDKKTHVYYRITQD